MGDGEHVVVAAHGITANHLRTGAWSEYVEAYIDHDLVERDGAYVSSVSLDAVREDTASTLIDDEVTGAAERLAVPTTFQRATRG